MPSTPNDRDSESLPEPGFSLWRQRRKSVDGLAALVTNEREAALPEKEAPLRRLGDPAQ